MKDLFFKKIRYLITEGIATPENFHRQKREILDSFRGAVARGIDLVQLREKNLTGSQLFEMAAAAVAVVEGTAIKVLVNERFDIALAAGAHGVHLSSRSIPAEVVRSNVPEGFIIGVSTHTGDETVAARDGDADFALFGPVFYTPGKGKASGLENLRKVCDAVGPFPVIAVGGIDESNFKDVLVSGAAGFASIRYLNEFVRMKE